MNDLECLKNMLNRAKISFVSYPVGSHGTKVVSVECGQDGEFVSDFTFNDDGSLSSVDASEGSLDNLPLRALLFQ